MAGVVAMASVIEDFDTQPCKKSRKDGVDSPVAKTITNYFSPVAKSVDKPFSPPRSNNIMDYFSRKPPSFKEKTGTPEQLKDDCQRPRSKDKPVPPEGATKERGKSSQRRRKPGKVRKRLQSNETFCSSDEGSRVDDGETAGVRDSGQTSSTHGILGSDTAVLLAELSADGCMAGRTAQEGNTETLSVTQPLDGSPKSARPTKGKPRLNCNGLSPIALSKDKGKRTRPSPTVPRERRPHKELPPEPEREESELSLCEASMEVNVDETSQVDTSTITVSFEEFLQSQNEGGDGKEEETKYEGDVCIVLDDLDSDQSDITKIDDNIGSVRLEVSPRTLTFQAEVHSVSSKMKSRGKLASIFTRRKEPPSSAGTSLSPCLQEGSPPRVVVKRKSNVVLQEEDLELAVVESESTLKCSQAERKQFMAAFKQPSPERARIKAGKGPGRQKQKGPGKTPDAGDQEEEEEEEEDNDDDDIIVEMPAERPGAPAEHDGGAKTKPARRGKRKAKKQQNKIVPSSAAASQEEPEAEAGAGAAAEGPTVRRSRREAPSRQAQEVVAAPATPAPVTLRRQRSEAAAAAQGDPLLVSTPKTHKSKRTVFKAELVGPANKKGSPIRMKFIRVCKDVSMSGRGTDYEILSPLAAETSEASKKRKRAKKLVEKAKVLQQSKAASSEEKSAVRRSARSQLKKSYNEDEDAVIFVEDDHEVARQKAKPQKVLRSLNDVLGKPGSKETRTPPASKASPLVLDRKPKAAVVSIFIESSRDSSENSQDDEQFRARRDFLKSGLPDSFRKQIAKTTATREAYSLSCSSFQTVVHVLQTQPDCPLWCLPWPESSLLRPLKDGPTRTSSQLLPALKGLFCMKTEPCSGAFREKGSGWRTELSQHVRQLLMDEISASNPTFPSQRFLTRFLERRSDHLLLCAASVTGTPAPVEPVGAKRKRVDEGETSGKVAKKQRSIRSEEAGISTPELEAPRRGARTSRAHRRRVEEEQQKVKPLPETPSVVSQDAAVIELDDSPPAGGVVTQDVMREEMLWTEKYQPQHSGDVVGNTASVRKLHSWLKEWKLRTAREESREESKKQSEGEREDGGNDSDWDCANEDSLGVDDSLCNTLLITGPAGVGKTAAVYACAHELGFKVFEVNASSQRSGRLIMSQLREATQSHQVDIQGINSHKPSYFNSYGAGSARSGPSPKKVNSPRRVVSSPRKPPQSPRGTKRGGLAPTSLAKFFKIGQPATSSKPKQTVAPKEASKQKGFLLKSQEPAVKTPPAAASSTITRKDSSGEEQSKKSATSLILFEEVDVIFDEDSGFLAAIKTFMMTTKRPVILTTSDPNFSTMFDGSFEEIHFKTPSVVNACSFLQLLCLAEDVRMDTGDVGALLRLNRCDIRQSLLQLQFWTRSSGGRRGAEPPERSDRADTEQKPEPLVKASAVQLPPCDAGCAESMLGLWSSRAEGSVQQLLTSPCPENETACRELLTDGKRRGVDLLYSNMAALLPIPVSQLTIPTRRPQPSIQPPSASLKPDAPLPDADKVLQVAEGSEESPVKVSKRMKKNKPGQNPLHSDSDSEDGFLSLCKAPGVSSQTEQEVEETPGPEVEKVPVEPLTPQQRTVSVPVTHCLRSIADFLDDMSFMDSSTSRLRPVPLGGAGRRGFGAGLKDGMVDEPSSEFDRDGGVEGQRGVEIQAELEALSFLRCRAGVEGAWGEAQQLKGEERVEAALQLTLPVAEHQKDFSLTHAGPCQPELLQKRVELADSLLSEGPLAILGNRAEVSLEYLPTLRTICRSEQLKEHGKVKRRFLHYLHAIHLGIPRTSLQQLAQDFP